MNDWPEGWTDDNRSGNGYGQGSASNRPESARSMPHVQRRPAPPQQRPAPSRQPQVPQQPGGYGDAPEYDSGYNTGQVYGGGQGGRGGGGGHGGGPGDGGYVQGRPGAAPDWRRRIKIGALSLVVVLLAVSVGTYFWADSKLKRDVDLSKVIERPKAGDGTNYLIVGSDSREGMTSEDKKRLHTGSAEGKRTDSMMILHDGSNGPTLVSLPRDSNVEIPSFVGSESGKKFAGTGRTTKLNAAYAEDGPELLVRTVEFNTGLHIDHYVEIGFGGFAKIVDAIGGVELDIPKAFKDKYSGADFQAEQADARRAAGSRLRPDPARLHLGPGPYEEPAEVPRGAGEPDGDAVDDPQPVQAVPDDGRRSRHPRRGQGHVAVVPEPDVLRHEGRHGR